MTTATATATYRKTRQGEWVAYGPADLVKPGASVVVTKKSGEAKTEHVATVGRSFTVDGVDMVYGYLDTSRRTPAAATTARASRSCQVCGSSRAHAATDMSGISGYACYRCDDGHLSFC